MPTPSMKIAERVRSRVRHEQTDPARAAEAVSRVAYEEVRSHNDYALARGEQPIDDAEACVREVTAMLTGYGPLQALLEDESVEEQCAVQPSQTDNG